MAVETMTRKGKRFVVLPWAEYRRLAALENQAPLPAMPPVAGDGTSSAIEFARASIARTIIRDRRAAGLSQEQLARLAGVRQETISRIESGRHTATVRVIDRIDRALRACRGVERGNGASASRRGWRSR